LRTKEDEQSEFDRNNGFIYVKILMIDKSRISLDIFIESIKCQGEINS